MLQKMSKANDKLFVFNPIVALKWTIENTINNEHLITEPKSNNLPFNKVACQFGVGESERTTVGVWCDIPIGNCLKYPLERCCLRKTMMGLGDSLLIPCDNRPMQQWCCISAVMPLFRNNTSLSSWLAQAYLMLDYVTFTMARPNDRTFIV